jgi:hypothetical protein
MKQSYYVLRYQRKKRGFFSPAFTDFTIKLQQKASTRLIRVSQEIRLQQLKFIIEHDFSNLIIKLDFELVDWMT